MRTQPIQVFLAAAGLVALCIPGCGNEGASEFRDAGADGQSTAGASGRGSGSTAGGIDFGDAASSAGETSAGSGVLTMTIRDFKLYAAGDPATNPDFENVPKTDGAGNPSTTYAGPWNDTDIVTDTLGSDGKPVYKGIGNKTLTTHGKDAFDQWFRDKAGTNVTVSYPLQLTRNAAGAFEFDSEKTGVPLSAGDPTKMFFPIDDGSAYATAFGNQTDPHNYSFTAELHTKFTYRGGEFFNFRGDDDVFVYIAGKLVINLGGIHAASPANVQVDTLGLTKGQDYTLDFFSAERHKTGSNILFTTTLDLRPSDVN
jgi:fibro-slime domain-containing protein